MEDQDRTSCISVNECGSSLIPNTEYECGWMRLRLSQGKVKGKSSGRERGDRERDRGMPRKEMTRKQQQRKGGHGREEREQRETEGNRGERRSQPSRDPEAEVSGRGCFCFAKKLERVAQESEGGTPDMPIRILYIYILHIIAL